MEAITRDHWNLENICVIFHNVPIARHNPLQIIVKSAQQIINLQRLKYLCKNLVLVGLKMFKNKHFLQSKWIWVWYELVLAQPQLISCYFGVYIKTHVNPVHPIFREVFWGCSFIMSYYFGLFWTSYCVIIWLPPPPPPHVWCDKWICFFIKQIFFKHTFKRVEE